jgi:hypothetical protein
MTTKTFAQAFAEARRAKGPGATFEWNGKLYTTDRADDKPRGAPKTSPAPKARSASVGPKSTAGIVKMATAAINRANAPKPVAGVGSRRPTGAATGMPAARTAGTTSGASRSTAGKTTSKPRTQSSSGIRRPNGTLNVGKALRSLAPSKTGSKSRQRRRGQ